MKCVCVSVCLWHGTIFPAYWHTCTQAFAHPVSLFPIHLRDNAHVHFIHLKKVGGEKLLYPANISCLPEHTHMVYLLKNLCRRGEDVLKQRLCASKTCTYVLRRVNKTFTTTRKGGKVYLKLTVIIVVINLLLVNCIFQLGCHLLQRLPLAVSFGDSIDFLLIKTTRYWFLV